MLPNRNLTNNRLILEYMHNIKECLLSAKQTEHVLCITRLLISEDVLWELNNPSGGDKVPVGIFPFTAAFSTCKLDKNILLCTLNV